MAGERALPDLISRIKVDSSGVDSAMTNLVSSFGKANLALAGVAAGIGLLIVGGKSMIDISEKHEQATLGLAQAVASYNASIGKAAPATADLSKELDVAGKAQDSLQIATNGLTLAQLAWSDAVHKHGLKSEEARKAQLHLDDADIHYKEAIDANRDAQEALTAAQEAGIASVKKSAINLVQYQSQIDDFIKTNRRYISDQSEVISGYATLTRSGLSLTETQRVMNDAVDLAALKHISLSDAVGLLDLAEHGRMRGLIDLGITTGKYTDAQGNLIQSSHSVANAMDEIDQKVKLGKLSLEPLTQAQNDLNNTWQDFAIKNGPAFVNEMTNVVNYVANNMPTWLNWLTTLNNIGNQLAAIPALFDAANRSGLGGTPETPVPSGPWSMSVWWSQKDQKFEQAGPIPVGSYVDPKTGVVMTPGYPSDHPTDAQGKQFGGPVLPGRVYTVGEAGPETLVMGASGGMVIPNSGGRGGGDTFHFHQVQTEPWQTANEIAWAKKTKRI